MDTSIESSVVTSMYAYLETCLATFVEKYMETSEHTSVEILRKTL